MVIGCKDRNVAVWGRGAGSDLESVRAAYASEGGNFRFRCSVCGGFHRAGQRAWRRCTDELARRWGLQGPDVLRPDGGPVVLQVEVVTGLFPTLAEGIRLGSRCPGTGWRSGHQKGMRPPVALAGPGAWVVLLALGALEAEKLLSAAWQRWWEEEVVRLLREFDGELRGYCGDGLSGPGSPRVVRWSPENERWLRYALSIEPCAITCDRPHAIHAGRRGAAYRLPVSDVAGCVATVVCWYDLRAQVRVYCPREVWRRGLVPPAWWFLDAAGLA